MITRRDGLAALIGLASTGSLVAQGAYPDRAIRILIPFSAGGTPDLIGRLVSEQLARQLGQAVIIDNRLGANGIIAADAVARAAPDGYTLLLNTGSQAINPSIYKKLPFDSIKDFAPVSLLMLAPALVLVVNNNFPAKTAKEFLALAKTPDSNISYGSPGIGNTLHLAGELLNHTAGLHMLHIPFKGAAPALNAVMAGDVSACFLSTTAALIAIKGNQVRPLAVTSGKRIETLPDVPTLAESGVPGFDYNGGWIAIFAPVKTPAPIVQSLSAAIHKALQVPKVRDQLLQWDSPAVGSTPEELDRFVQSETDRFARIVKLANVQAQ